MDDLLPSYESTIHQNPWALIAPYLPSETLCSAALVCQAWHQIMTPQLWGNPASHFGVQNDTVYVALTRFKRTLPYVRPCICELTHTLQLPPAHAEIYGGPHAEWLRDCLEYLPRLQSLLVNGLPFFDHAALLCLRHTSLRRRANRPPTFPVFGLRLLDASGCTNATSSGLTEALSHLPYLVSLDLSRTPAARDEAVLNKLRTLGNLRLLNLKSLALRDADFAIVALAIGTRVRSLDVSDNKLTDASARNLLENCMKEETLATHPVYGPIPPVESRASDGDIDAFESENVVAHVRGKLTGGFVGSLAIETARDVGVTHLFISNNAMTVEGISGLLRSRRLQVLDMGILPAMMKQPYQPSLGDAVADIELPGVSKLTPILSKFGSAKLKYLRINSGIVTQDAPNEAGVSQRAELDGGDIDQKGPDAHELEATESPIMLLDPSGSVIVEAPGDMVHPGELHGSVPAISMPNTVYPAELEGTLPTVSNMDGTPASADCGTCFMSAKSTPPDNVVTAERHDIVQVAEHAPEPALAVAGRPPTSPLESHHNRPTESVLIPSDDHALLSPLAFHQSQSSPSMPSKYLSRRNSSCYVEDRRASLDLQQSQERCLHPGSLPKVHTLVLTDVPALTNDRKVIDRLIQFVKDASEEAAIARERAGHTYALPPGRSRVIAEREHANNLFALKRIVFETAPPQAALKKISSSWRAYPTKSSTEDADSENFWQAASHDFSFFGEEECGLPESEPGRALPLAAMSGLELAPERAVPLSEPTRGAENESEPLFDVISEISRFRRERKAAYMNMVQMGHPNPDVEGYWAGDITVVRKAVGQDVGELDCYGNRYESGWYYR